MDGDDRDRVRANYRDNHARPVAVKRRYDPGNLFRLDHDIAP
ncbi:BBE domain-containing protein [Streptomyces hirsutus]